MKYLSLNKPLIYSVVLFTGLMVLLMPTANVFAATVTLNPISSPIEPGSTVTWSGQISPNNPNGVVTLQGWDGGDCGEGDKKTKSSPINDNPNKWENTFTAPVVEGTYHYRVFYDGVYSDCQEIIVASETSSGSITIEKLVTGDEVENWSFDFSGDLDIFSLSNENVSITENELEIGDYTINEDSLPEGWTFEGIACFGTNEDNIETSDQSVTISLQENEEITCTFTNKFTNDSEEEQIRICHGPDFNNLEELDIDENGINGHNVNAPAHNGDIIPPLGDFLGKNWGSEGQAIWNNGCEVPEEEQGGSMINVCKIIKDNEGNIIDGSGVDTSFSVLLEGPNDFSQEIDFNTALTLNEDRVDNNNSDLDSQCVTINGLESGKYTYSEEDIDNSTPGAIWGTPLYHDYFTGSPESISDFLELTVDGSETDDDDADGVINLGEEDERSLVIVNTLEEKPELCSVTIVSDETNVVEEKDGVSAKLLSFIHDAWTASIDGADWIWGDDPVSDPEEDTVQTFIKNFGWNGPVVSATLEIASDNSNQFDLNGTVDGDSSENNHQAGTQDSYNVSSAVNQGNNTLAIEITNLGQDGETSDSNPAGLLYKLTIEGTDENCNIPYNEEPEEPEESEEDPWCSFDGEVIETTSDEEAYQNDGDLVDSNRRNISAIENGVASYANFGGSEGNSWSTNDFFSLGIEGYLVYEFKNQVVFDQPGDDIAIYEITGGNNDTDEKAKVYVSQNGIDFELVGTVTGDGSVDISSTGLSFVKYVKLVDDSLGIQGNNGDGYDVDAIVILNGSCGDEPDSVTLVAHKIMCESEEDLPNWAGGNNGAPSKITFNTAEDFVEENNSCYLESNWEFEWGPEGSGNPGGSFIGQANGYTTFGPTNQDGFTLTNILTADLGSRLELREVLKDGYVSFSDGNNNDTSPSAEFYCDSGMNLYDNWVWLSDLESDETYYCVAFNTPEGESNQEEPEYITVDLEVDKSVNDNSPDEEQTVIYTVTVTNNGPAEATGVLVNDSLPSGVTYVSDNSSQGSYSDVTGEWSVGSLNDGESATLDITVTVNDGTEGETITNTASVESNEEDTDLENNSDDVGFYVTLYGGGTTGGLGTQGGSVLGVTTLNDDNEEEGEVLGESCQPLLKTYIKPGADNDPEEVEKLQQFLNEEMGANLLLTGFYDSITQNYVEQFQLKYAEDILAPWEPFGLDPNTPTGYVYKTTQWWINVLSMKDCVDVEEIPFPELP